MGRRTARWEGPGRNSQKLNRYKEEVVGSASNETAPTAGKKQPCAQLSHNTAENPSECRLCPSQPSLPHTDTPGKTIVIASTYRIPLGKTMDTSREGHHWQPQGRSESLLPHTGPKEDNDNPKEPKHGNKVFSEKLPKSLRWIDLACWVTRFCIAGRGQGEHE